jgi:hypothetical protein
MSKNKLKLDEVLLDANFLGEFLEHKNGFEKFKNSDFKFSGYKVQIKNSSKNRVQKFQEYKFFR